MKKIFYCNKYKIKNSNYQKFKINMNNINNNLMNIKINKKQNKQSY